MISARDVPVSLSFFFIYFKLFYDLCFLCSTSIHEPPPRSSTSPDDSVFKYLALTYSQHHPVMRQGSACGDHFSQGITNGADWYELTGAYR